jgi:hypothetical protein
VRRHRKQEHSQLYSPNIITAKTCYLNKVKRTGGGQWRERIFGEVSHHKNYTKSGQALGIERSKYRASATQYSIEASEGPNNHRIIEARAHGRVLQAERHSNADEHSGKSGQCSEARAHVDRHAARFFGAASGSRSSSGASDRDEPT